MPPMKHVHVVRVDASLALCSNRDGASFMFPFNAPRPPQTTRNTCFSCKSIRQFVKTVLPILIFLDATSCERQVPTIIFPDLTIRLPFTSDFVFVSKSNLPFGISSQN